MVQRNQWFDGSPSEFDHAAAAVIQIIHRHRLRFRWWMAVGIFVRRKAKSTIGVKLEKARLRELILYAERCVLSNKAVVGELADHLIGPSIE